MAIKNSVRTVFRSYTTRKHSYVAIQDSSRPGELLICSADDPTKPATPLVWVPFHEEREFLGWCAHRLDSYLDLKNDLAYLPQTQFVGEDPLSLILGKNAKSAVASPKGSDTAGGKPWLMRKPKEEPKPVVKSEPVDALAVPVAQLQGHVPRRDRPVLFVSTDQVKPAKVKEAPVAAKLPKRRPTRNS